MIYSAIKLFGEQDGGLEQVLMEEYKCQQELQLIDWVNKFFRFGSGKYLNFKSVVRLCLSGKMQALPISKRMDLYCTKMAAKGCCDTAQLLKALIALKIKGSQIPYSRSYCGDALKCFDDWANAEILSNDHLLFTYIKSRAIVEGGKKNLQSYKYSMIEELPGIEEIDPASDHYLGQLVLKTKLRDPYGGAWKDSDLELFIDKLRGDAEETNFARFLADIGHEVLISPEVVH